MNDALRTLALLAGGLLAACTSTPPAPTEASAADATGSAPSAGETVESAAPAVVPADAYAKPGFETFLVDGRLWVFRSDSADLEAFRDAGEVAVSVTRPGAGPGGLTVRAPDADTIVAYTAARAGFETRVRDGRVWVFRDGDGALAAFERDGELAAHVMRPGLGPGGVTLKAPDRATVEAYLAAKPGFETRIVDGRVWVFRRGSAAAEAFDEAGEPADRVTWPGLGPGGATLMAPDRETGLGYAAACEGFVTEVVDGRLWVFRADDPGLEAFRRHGEPARSVTRPTAGPAGLTVRAPDRATLDAYLRQIG